MDEERCANCADLAVGCCLHCDALVCDECGVPVRDGDRLCPMCADFA